MTQVTVTSPPFFAKHRTKNALNIPVESLKDLDRKSHRVVLNVSKLETFDLSEKVQDFDRVNFVSGAALMSYEFEGIESGEEVKVLLGDLKMKT